MELGSWLEYGIMGAAAIFALLSFYLVQKLIAAPAHRRPSSQPVYLFMGLTIVFIGLGILSDWLKSKQLPDAFVLASLDEIQSSVISNIVSAQTNGQGAADNSSDNAACSSNGARASAAAAAAKSELERHLIVLRQALISP